MTILSEALLGEDGRVGLVDIGRTALLVGTGFILGSFNMYSRADKATRKELDRPLNDIRKSAGQKVLSGFY